MEPISNARSKVRQTAPETRLVRLARDGVVSRAVALAGGVSAAQINHRLETGFLIADAPGVYRLAGSERSGRTAERGALLATSGQALGLWSALAGHGVNQRSDAAKVHVLVEHRRRIKSTGWYQVHRTRELDSKEIVLRSGISMTTVARAIRDLAAALPHRDWADAQLEQWIEEGLQLQKMTLPQLERGAQAERAPHTKARLERLAERQRGHDPALFKSIGERWLKELVQRRSLPMPKFNAKPFPDSTMEVDAYWEHILIAEFDGFAFHKTRTKHDQDRRRDRWAWRRGVPVVRITSDDFEHDLPALEADIEAFVLRPR